MVYLFRAHLAYLYRNRRDNPIGAFCKLLLRNEIRHQLPIRVDSEALKCCTLRYKCVRAGALAGPELRSRGGLSPE